MERARHFDVAGSFFGEIMNEEKELATSISWMVPLQKFWSPIFFAAAFLLYFFGSYLPTHEQDMRHQIDICYNHILEIENKLDILLQRKTP